MRRGLLPFLVLAFFVSMILGVSLGSSRTSLKDLMNGSESAKTIVLGIRLPRVVMASIVGATLAAVGGAFQGVMKNPLVDPYLVGVSAGASFGAVLTLSLAESFGPFWLNVVPVISFVGALTASLIVLLVSRRGSTIPTTELVLAGVIVSMVFNSGTVVLNYFFRRSAHGLAMWIFGDLSGSVWKDTYLPALGLATFLAVNLPLSRKLDAMSFGEDFAKVSGVDSDSVKITVLITGILAASIAVSEVGAIGFVGLVVPHIVRIAFGPKHSIVLTLGSVTGAIFLILADLVSRVSIPPLEIPIGVVTSFIGVPLFVFLMRRRGSGW